MRGLPVLVDDSRSRFLKNEVLGSHSKPALRAHKLVKLPVSGCCWTLIQEVVGLITIVRMCFEVCRERPRDQLADLRDRER